MAGQFPVSPKPQSVTLRSFQPSMVSVSHSLTTQTRSRGSQRWSLEARFAPVHSWATFAPIFAFLLKQRGRAEQFTFTLPGDVMPARGNWGTILVDGGGQSGNSLNLKGFSNGDADAVKAGDLIQWSKKIYIVTDDSASDGAGLASVNIEPAIIAAPLADAPVAIHQSGSPLSLYCSLGADEAEMNFNHCVKYGMTISMGENIES